MTKNEIRIRAEQIVGAYVPNIRDYHNLVERLCDLIEDVTEFDRDTAFEAGYVAGFDDGQDEESRTDDWGDEYYEEDDEGSASSLRI